MTTSSEVFFDTNVLAYIFSGDPEKSARSEDLLAEGGTISVQILNECALLMRRKFKATWRQIEVTSQTLRKACAVLPLTEATHVHGLAIAKRFRLHIYDAMIVSSALNAGCTTLFSEDMHAGLKIDGLTIRNPYT